MSLTNYSLKQLEDEIKIRKQIKMVPYSQRNYTYLEEYTKEFIKKIIEKSDDALNYEDFFKLAAKTFYGVNIFEKIYKI